MPGIVLMRLGALAATADVGSTDALFDDPAGYSGQQFVWFRRDFYRRFSIAIGHRADRVCLAAEKYSG